ncbi:DUF998 domain-containing protein [Candidatus Berkelbacteria bacterium]|nr:DUF998 domain-containing protein [Candidatus Berkelbacteria bacterium]
MTSTPYKVLRATSWLGLFGPVFFFSLLGFLGTMWPGYSPIATGMSELGAVNSPVKTIMNFLGFSTLGITITVFAVGLYNYLRSDWQLKLASLFVLIAGLGMIVVGFLPCDPNCIDTTIIGHSHSLVSMIPAIIMPIGAMVSAHSLAKRWGNAWGRLFFALGFLSLLSGPIMFLDSTISYTGLIQRLGIGGSLLWMMIVSTKILLENKDKDKK